MSEFKEADKESESILKNANFGHWAYKKGYQDGLKKDRITRGIMRFGLNMAGDMETILNTRQYLAGFYCGLKKAIQPNEKEIPIS